MDQKPTHWTETAANAYLDQLAERFKISSNYGLAKILNISPQAVAKIRRGGGMSTMTAIRTAELLGAEHPFGVISSLILDKGHPLDTPDKRVSREALEKFLRAMKGVVLAVALGLAGGLHNQNVRAATPTAEPIYTYATKCPK